MHFLCFNFFLIVASHCTRLVHCFHSAALPESLYSSVTESCQLHLWNPFVHLAKLSGSDLIAFPNTMRSPTCSQSTITFLLSNSEHHTSLGSPLVVAHWLHYRVWTVKSCIINHSSPYNPDLFSLHFLTYTFQSHPYQHMYAVCQ